MVSSSTDPTTGSSATGSGDRDACGLVVVERVGPVVDDVLAATAVVVVAAVVEVVDDGELLGVGGPLDVGEVPGPGGPSPLAGLVVEVVEVVEVPGAAVVRRAVAGAVVAGDRRAPPGAPAARGAAAPGPAATVAAAATLANRVARARPRVWARWRRSPGTPGVVGTSRP